MQIGYMSNMSNKIDKPIYGKPTQAIAVFDGKKIKGTVVFTEDLDNNSVIIDINVEGLKKNGLHGFHVHESGDLTSQCDSMCAHLNQRRIKMCHFNSSGSDTSNDLKRAPRRGAVLNLHLYKSVWKNSRMSRNEKPSRWRFRQFTYRYKWYS
jgi:Copper/zinc superoxide dismutase (SODC)